MKATDIIKAGLEAMEGFGMDISGIENLAFDSDKANAILDSLEGETEDTRLIELLNTLVK